MTFYRVGLVIVTKIFSPQGRLLQFINETERLRIFGKFLNCRHQASFLFIIVRLIFDEAYFAVVYEKKEITFLLKCGKGCAFHIKSIVL